MNSQKMCWKWKVKWEIGINWVKKVEAFVSTVKKRNPTRNRVGKTNQYK